MSFNDFVPEIERWVALRTAARWEKKIAEMLRQTKVPVFLPVMTRTTRYATKTQRSDIPLFPGYVFCSEVDFLGNAAVPQACRKQIAQVLKPGDSAQLRIELQQLAEIVSSHELIQECFYGSPGERVRIISGPLCGSEGTILALKPNKRTLVLEITFLGVRLEAEVEEQYVKKEV